MATPTAQIDAQGQNDIERNTRQWKDLDLFFSKKVGSNDINTLTDITAVKRSVRNLVLTNHYEKPFHPEIGSGVRAILFELMTPMTAFILTKKIENIIKIDLGLKIIGLFFQESLNMILHGYLILKNVLQIQRCNGRIM